MKKGNTKKTRRRMILFSCQFIANTTESQLTAGRFAEMVDHHVMMLRTLGKTTTMISMMMMIAEATTTMMITVLIPIQFLANTTERQTGAGGCTSKVTPLLMTGMMTMMMIPVTMMMMTTVNMMMTMEMSHLVTTEEEIGNLLAKKADADATTGAGGVEGGRGKSRDEAEDGAEDRAEDGAEDGAEVKAEDRA